MAPAEAPFFRANVGLAVIDESGRILAVERWPEGAHRWQMAQGGIDEGEEPLDAAYRELHEELGLLPSDVELVAEHPEWLTYELPKHARALRLGLGQSQRWFLFRLVTGSDHIDLDVEDRERPELVRWRWTTLARLAEETWEPRRPIYRRLAEDWAELLAH